MGRAKEGTKYGNCNVALRIAMEEGRPVHVFEDLEGETVPLPVPTEPGTFCRITRPRTLARDSGEFRFFISSEGSTLSPISSILLPGPSEAAEDLLEPVLRGS